MNRKTVINKPAMAKPIPGPPRIGETEPNRLDRILSRREFKTLKAVSDHLGMDSLTAPWLRW